MLLNHLQLIKDGCLPSIVQTHNDYFVLWGKKSRLHLPSANMFLFSLEHTSNLELHNSFQSKTRTKVHTDKIKDRQTSVIQSKVVASLHGNNTRYVLCINC